MNGWFRVRDPRWRGDTDCCPRLRCERKVISVAFPDACLLYRRDEVPNWGPGSNEVILPSFTEDALVSINV